MTQAANLSGTGVCVAWANFDGTVTPITFRAAYNVTSVTRNSAGNYTVNFLNALADTNYAVVFGAPYFNPGNPPWVFQNDYNTARTTTAFRMWTNQGGASYNSIVEFAVFR
jgi:hypothetical protein